MLELKHIYKRYHVGTANEMNLFQDFNLKIEAGEFVSVVGSNGSGKSSMLNLICGGMEAEAGSILIQKQNITREKEYQRNQKIGRVYQNPAMGTCGSMTLLENLSLADQKGKRYGFRRGVDKRRIPYYQELLRCLELGLEEKLYTKAEKLSGGQRQAVALLMATMAPIDFLILDEHTAALDPKTAERNMALTNRFVKEKKLTAIMVTHNLRYALEYGNRLLMLHQGKLVLDMKQEEKSRCSVEALLKLFHEMNMNSGKELLHN